MPKLIDYPRTSYTGAWEVAEVIDDTGGKCALETSARKLNRKVSGSFKAIVGSAVKFGLLTSKREVLTTTTLFRRIKHAYDKQEELLFHREAFLTPPLFTQLCRKFRSRELPVAMLDVLLMREFDVEEINAQSVAKAFTDGARMVGLLNENNVVADIDQLAAQQPPRRELANPTPAPNVFRQNPPPVIPANEGTETETQIEDDNDPTEADSFSDAAPASDNSSSLASDNSKAIATAGNSTGSTGKTTLPAPRPAPPATTDAIANLFGLGKPTSADRSQPSLEPGDSPKLPKAAPLPPAAHAYALPPESARGVPSPAPSALRTPPGAGTPTETEVVLFTIQLAGPGLNTQLDVTDVEDLILVRALLDKIERRLKK